MPARPSRLDLRKASVLVIDDNQQSLDILIQVLTGFRVKNVNPCRSAEEAHELLPLDRFDLIVIDADMPDESGFELTRHIRSAPDEPNFTAPIVIVSGYTPTAVITQACDAGAHMVIKKPIAPAVLLSRIEWIARNNRDFVTTESYCGPDRRFRSGPPPEGVEERRAEALALTAAPERSMSQDEIDSLF